jgi:hypothetical protein
MFVHVVPVYFGCHPDDFIDVLAVHVNFGWFDFIDARGCAHVGILPILICSFEASAGDNQQMVSLTPKYGMYFVKQVWLKNIRAFLPRASTISQSCDQLLRARRAAVAPSNRF